MKSGGQMTSAFLLNRFYCCYKSFSIAQLFGIKQYDVELLLYTASKYNVLWKYPDAGRFPCTQNAVGTSIRSSLAVNSSVVFQLS